MLRVLESMTKENYNRLYKIWSDVSFLETRVAWKVPHILSGSALINLNVITDYYFYCQHGFVLKTALESCVNSNDKDKYVDEWTNLKRDLLIRMISAQLFNELSSIIKNNEKDNKPKRVIKLKEK